ncbi:MAG: guanine deaminase [Alkalilacustris sp.]
MPDLLLGQTLTFAGDPFAEGPGAARHEPRGGVLIEGGRIAALGAAEALRRDHPGAVVRDYGQALISAGFVDCHMHYPQTGIVARWGRRLIDWLNDYTFPEEMRLADPAHAAAIAALTCDLALDHGTTTLASFCTTAPGSVDAFFEAAAARGMRVIAGRTCMDRNGPPGLLDTPETAAAETEALIARWHGRGRAGYAITPRFAPTSSPEQLRLLAEIWAAHPDCALQTHLGEQTEEIAWVAELFPAARDYLDVYDSVGMAGPGAVFGHAIHLTGRERARLAQSGAGVAHCPTSNAFIGSGLCDVAGLKAAGVPVGLATDTGGGSSFSMLRTMAAAYDIGQLRGHALHPAELWWLATAGSAEVLRLGDRVGRLAVEMEADLVVVDLASTPAIAQRAARAEGIWEAVFPTIMMGDDRAVRAVWVDGKAVRDRGAG